MPNNQWVSPRGDRWAVHSEKTGRDSRIFATQREAMDYATGVAKKQKSELIVQGRDGRIREKRSFGNDPNPPRG